jgi:arylformamidase
LRIVDLTHEMPSNSPIPLDALNFHSNRSENKLLATRIEAPAYLVSGGKTLDLLEPASLVRDAVLLDLTHMKPNQLIDDEDLEAAEEGAGLSVRDGEVVVLHTGWEKHAQSEDYWSSHPALSENGAEFLEFKRVTGVAVDAPNMDSPGNSALPVHSILMRRGIFVIENLCNLGEIDQSRFRMVALPLRIRAVSSFVRAVGILEDEFWKVDAGG